MLAALPRVPCSFAHSLRPRSDSDLLISTRFLAGKIVSFLLFRCMSWIFRIKMNRVTVLAQPSVVSSAKWSLLDFSAVSRLEIPDWKLGVGGRP
jgi:hypothetical protein